MFLFVAFSGKTFASNCCVLPSCISVGAFAISIDDTGIGFTVTVKSCFAPDAETVIVAVPSFTAVSELSSFTFITLSSLD